MDQEQQQQLLPQEHLQTNNSGFEVIKQVEQLAMIMWLLQNL
jgi:hypothetical protein